MEIRYITASDDRKKLSRIYERSWKYAYRGLIPQEYLDSNSEGLWVNNFDIPGWSTMVCVEDGEFIGTSSFCESKSERFSGSGEIISIYFLPEYTGKGYGKRLLGAVLDQLRAQGFSRAFLWVLEGNERAMGFYEACGFKRTEDFTDDRIGGRDVREIRYVIDLPDGN